jgi:hypothetical protein
LQPLHWRLIGFAGLRGGIEQTQLLGTGGFESEVIVRQSGRNSASGSAIKKADLNQVGFDDLFD